MSEDHYKHPVNEKKVKFRVNLIGSKKENITWIITITIISFFLTAVISLISTKILEDVNNIIAFCVVLIIIAFGVIFDIIGTAATAADEAPFHAMASRKVYGARQAIGLVRNANKVSSICCDVVGDISGVISGAASAFIIIRVIEGMSITEATLISLMVSGLVASITIGGKAMGKTIAIHNSNYIIYRVSVLLKFFTVKIIFLKARRSIKKNRKRKNK